ncbi:glycoside hydrolase superfamily [Chytridium lagenaria]|nr:glycoside hydrolase superfamily [Chytridium lagenaria]
MGINLCEVVGTWEALGKLVELLKLADQCRNGGPGIYDEEYIDYLIKIMEKMAKYGIKCFIDPHQDTWSRYSGGSGAPGWTFEVAGMDLTTFRQVGAAHISDVTEPSTTKHQYWPTNYAKLACCTMFTLFFGGETFAPKTLYKGESVQHFLQRHFINAFAHLATRLKDCPAVIGFEVMNEPHFGYIGLPSIHHFDPLTTLHFGPFPSALESFALGSGVSLDVPFYVQSWPWPTQKAGTKRLNDEKLSAWIDGRKCIWEEHGVWKMVDGKPVPLKTDYFSKHPITGRKVNFDNDFYMPFIRNYIKAIQAVKADNLVFFEPIPNEDPPVFNEIDATMQNVVYAPHWYDLKTLFSKSWDGIITHDVRGLSRGTKNVLAATYFGISGAMKNYGGQISSIVKIGIDNVGTRPVVFGECGMPMDINKKRAFGTGDYKLHTHFMDTCLSAMETNLVYFTLWNYNPMNDNTHGDYWNGEDFSIYSPETSSLYLQLQLRLQHQLSYRQSSKRRSL